jgi:hypothetical protein
MKKQVKRMGNSYIKKRAFVVLTCALLGFSANAQTNDSIPKPSKDLKNTIKFNLTSKLLYPNSYLFSYERVVGKNQSVNVFGGYQEFPLSLNLPLPDIRLIKSKDKSGYSIGLDYRFYLPKENRNNAPQGVYLAPFTSLYDFQFVRGLEYTYDDVKYSSDLISKINILLIGGQLGYQFVMWKRLVIDAVVFGPALTYYDFNVKLSEELSGLQPDEALHAYIDALKEKFPLLNDLTSDQGINKSSREAFWSIGFRYSISVGFRF